MTVAGAVRRIVDEERNPNIKRLHELEKVTRDAMLPALFRKITNG